MQKEDIWEFRVLGLDMDVAVSVATTGGKGRVWIIHNWQLFV